MSTAVLSWWWDGGTNIWTELCACMCCRFALKWTHLQKSFVSMFVVTCAGWSWERTTNDHANIDENMLRMRGRDLREFELVQMHDGWLHRGACVGFVSAGATAAWKDGDGRITEAGNGCHGDGRWLMHDVSACCNNLTSRAVPSLMQLLRVFMLVVNFWIESEW